VPFVSKKARVGANDHTENDDNSGPWSNDQRVTDVDGHEANVSGASAPPPAAASRISDLSKLLTSLERQSLEAELRNIESTQGDRLWILATRLPSSRSADAAASAISRWHLAPAPPRATVLIVVDATSRRAAIETGQGVEGPMTSLEVAALLAKTGPFLKSGLWAAGLRQIVQGVAATCAATRTRRSPPQEARDPAAEGNATAPSPPPARGEGRDASSSAPENGRRSGLLTRLVGGGAVAFLLLVALRQRKKNAERSAELARRPAPPKYLGPPRIDR